MYLALIFVFTQVQADDKKDQIKLEESKSQSITLKFELDDIQKIKLHTPRGEAFYFTMQEGTPLLKKGAPAVPKISSSVIVPDKANMTLSITDYDYYEIKETEIVPSKGNLLRTIDPSNVPYTYGEEYEQDDFYPGTLAKMSDPYILRNFRGQTVQFFPVQYNPVSQTVRIYTSITVEVVESEEKSEMINAFERTNIDNMIPEEFDAIYKNHFINYPTDSRYTPLEEEGNMLIISPAEYSDLLTDFVEWKTQRGMSVEVVDLSVTGSSATDIQSYVANYYNTNGLTYLLLIGDAEDIPSLFTSGDSDAAYGHIEGDDSYAEVFVGRFSAESSADVTTQVQRTIHYERDIAAGENWMQNGIGIASDEGEGGAGDDGESDIQHMDNIRSDLTGYGYTTVDQVYDPGATPADVGDAMNAGRGVINYVGHGSDTYWVTSGFSITEVNNLTNDNQLPFIFDVACVNGNFHGQTCFAESFLRATNADQPTGAAAIIASTINQSWAPPMDGQDEMNDILVESYTNNIKRTFGGITINGCFHMNDEYGDGGDEMTDTWTIFGDPSLLVRTQATASISISHPDQLLVGSGSLTITGEDDIHVVLTKDGSILAKGKTSGGSLNLNFDALNEVTNVLLTAYGYNKETYQVELPVQPADQPYLGIAAKTLNDASGNGDGLLNAGEAVTLSVDVENVSDSYDALNVEATLVASSDPHLTVTDDAETVGTVSGGATVSLTDAFSFGVDALAEDGQSFEFTLILDGEDSEGNVYQWTSKFSYTVHAGGLAFTGAMLIDDSSGGDGDGELEAGETAAIRMAVENTGSVDLSDVTGSLSMVGGSHPDVTLNTSSVGPISIASGTSETISYSVTLAGTAEKGDILPFKFEVTGGSLDQYSDVYVNEYKIPLDVYTIDQEGTHNVCDALFYDSGGAEGTYSNDEDYIITFVSSSPGEALTIDFKEFDVESNSTCSWDSLAIYDGLDVTSEQIGRYCGTSGPGLVTSTNIDNALTVVFHSDGSVTNPGWAAEIYCGTATTPQTHDITFIVSDSEGFLSGATVDFNGEQQVTNASGEALFTGVETSNDLPYSISATGYVGTSGTVTVYETASIPVLLENEVYDITINLYGDDGVTEVDGDVTLGTTTQTTVNGTTVFYNEPYGLSKSIDVSTTNCQPYSGTIDVDSDRSEDIVLTYIRHDVTFTVDDGTDPISGAIVEFDGQEQQTDATGATVFTDVIQTLGKEYTIRKSGYSNVTGSVDVTGDITEPVSMSAGQATFKVTFTVSDGTDPLSGAEVSFNSTLETTNSEGKVVFDGVVPANGMSYSVSKSGYDLYEGSLDVVDSNVEEPVVLVLTTHDITFSVSDGSSALEGASVTLDAVEQTTNASGETVFTDQLPASGVSFTVSMEGYADSTGTVDIDSDKTLDIALDIYTYDIVFEVSDKENGEAVEALVAFNDLEQASTEGSTTFAGVEYGKEMPYTVTASGYEDYAGSLNATSNLTEQVKLVPLTYNVTFAVEDAEGTALSGVAISFNEEELSTGSEGTAVFSSVRPGTGLAYTLTKSGYETKDGTLDVKDANVTETVTMSATTGIVDFADAGITVYPNPSDGNFTLSLTNEVKGQLFIYSPDGRKLFEETIHQGNTNISIPNPNTGLYILRFVTEDMTYHSRILLQK